MPPQAKKSTARTGCLERSRGSFGTKVHALVDALGNCLHLALTSAECADSPQLPALLATLAQPPGVVVCDRAYDTNNVLTAIATQGATSVIPPKSTCLAQQQPNVPRPRQPSHQRSALLANRRHHGHGSVPQSH